MSKASFKIGIYKGRGNNPGVHIMCPSDNLDIDEIRLRNAGCYRAYRARVDIRVRESEIRVIIPDC